MGKVIPMPLAKDAGQVSPPLVGTKENPARDPSATAKGNTMKGTVGDRALMDSIVLISIAWALLFMLFFSLRGHNV
jgi:hypothetical protein